MLWLSFAFFLSAARAAPAELSFTTTPMCGVGIYDFEGTAWTFCATYLGVQFAVASDRQNAVQFDLTAGWDGVAALRDALDNADGVATHSKKLAKQPFVLSLGVSFAADTRKADMVVPLASRVRLGLLAGRLGTEADGQILAGGALGFDLDLVVFRFRRGEAS